MQIQELIWRSHRESKYWQEKNWRDNLNLKSKTEKPVWQVEFLSKY